MYWTKSEQWPIDLAPWADRCARRQSGQYSRGLELSGDHERVTIMAQFEEAVDVCLVVSVGRGVQGRVVEREVMALE